MSSGKPEDPAETARWEAEKRRRPEPRRAGHASGEDCCETCEVAAELATERTAHQQTLAEVSRLRTELAALAVHRRMIVEAKRRLKAHIVASAHLLDAPFSNAPEQSPWTRIKAAVTALDAAVDALPATPREDAEPVATNLTDAASEDLCRRPLPYSAIGSICGLPDGHDGPHGEPMADTPRTPKRRPAAPGEETDR